MLMGSLRYAAPAGILELLMLLGTADGQSKLTSEQNAISLSPGKYRHLDRATNEELTCDKCPAGTYVSKHCTKSTLRECSPCPDGTFTKHENGIERCHPCRNPCELPMIEKTHCTALTDRECTCLSGTFQTNDTCVPYTVCPVGWGVRKKGTETEDVRCKPCPRGTFSDVPSSVMKCKPYTDCFAKNMVVIKPGTKESDNVCGSPASLPNTALTSSSTEAGEQPYEVPPTADLPKAANLNFTSTLSRCLALGFCLLAKLMLRQVLARDVMPYRISRAVTLTSPLLPQV
ncbi:hypothetical protein DV515_00000641 [Chloebia gouldiae]|uniref:TNFR-Cys domain-containing protein n=1 Tax=Chloebia gouldiae TaxID=44316 RepID=A0A3L8T0I4_CHLGU|nr:hypothetical protein DV515_00000641 [Chloebia gouldiae]